MTRKLLITRPLKEAIRLAETCSRFVEPDQIIVAPVMEILPVQNNARLVGYDAVIFTSKRAVQFAPAGNGKKAFCVGGATCNAAKDNGYDAIAASGNAQTLIELISNSEANNLVHFRGTNTRGDVGDILRMRGVHVDEYVMYDQVRRNWSAKETASIEQASDLIVPIFSPKSAIFLGERLAKFPCTITPIFLSAAVRDAWASFRNEVGLIAAETSEDAVVAKIRSEFS